MLKYGPHAFKNREKKDGHGGDSYGKDSYGKASGNAKATVDLYDSDGEVNGRKSLQ